MAVLKWTVFTFIVMGMIEGHAQAQSRRCFQFTWLGPRWNNESVFLNATCEDSTRLTTNVPCQQPLVVTYDGSHPDTDNIWTHHPDASCLLSDNDVCATYTYYFNGVVENSTHMCTRAVDSKGSAITSGCYQEVKGSYTTQVCLCRSVAGGVPCNIAAHQISSMAIVLLFTVLTFSLDFCR